jgi:pimeloyl-ACP methyl ester carboxylesterase
MRRWLALPVMFAAAALLALSGAPRPAQAQDGKPVEETFTTADGVRLKGLFHRSPKGGQGDPVVVLLYPPGPDRTMLKPGDWDGLAKTLNDNGFHVFRFDWRGHGKSTDITDPLGDGTGFSGFWTNRFTGLWHQNPRYVVGANRRPVKNELNVKTDIRPGYFPVYATDLAAVRLHLDQKNDQGDLNSSSIYLIGAGDTATLAMLWLAAEWNRPAVAPVLGAGLQYKYTPMPGIVVDPPAGADIAGAIWLSASRPSVIPAPAVANWVRSNLKLRDNNPMLFLYGEKDSSGASGSRYFYDQVLVAKGNRSQGVKDLEQTFLTAVPKTSLSGVNLLGKNAETGTEDTIVKYLQARQKDRVALTRKMRNYVGPYFIDLRYFGLAP